MPRRNRRIRPEQRYLPSHGGALLGPQTVPGPSWTNGEPFIMRHIGSSAAKKFYVCPGCNQNIPPGVAHIVAWPRDTGGQGDDRRHWHRHCWDRR
ncbi:hypothetical protein ACKFRM_10200 [Corynebacterium sp. YSMAA1_1_D6]|uniref:hypothetical protein n=1 Tax=Corynebacterium sp. YSMAA1_1_D6 TaxID=3383589 RepID=UPI0038D042FB